MQREQRTFIAVKPDGVKRGLTGEIIKRFEAKGFKLIGLKMLDVTPEMAEKHYGEHKGKPFYPRLIEYIQSCRTANAASESLNRGLRVARLWQWFGKVLM